MASAQTIPPRTALPRGKARQQSKLQDRHHGETGIVVGGRFEPLVYWPSVKNWIVIWVQVDGDDIAQMKEGKSGPTWIPLPPGTHVVEFRGAGVVHRTERITLGEGQAFGLFFAVPLRRPFLATTSPRWWVNRLW